MVDAGNYGPKLGTNSAPEGSTGDAIVLRSLDSAMLGDSIPELMRQPIDRSVSLQGAAPAEPPASSAPSTEGGLTPVPFSFGPPPPPACSISKCAKGHQWRPELRIAVCPGCQSPMLVLLMQNCPACNEPTAATNLRLDHMPQQSGQLMPICRGSATMAEPILIEMRHQHAADEQERHVVREVVSKV